MAPGSVVTTPASPELWFSSGASVTVEATAADGFGFVGWTGGLAGLPNPATLLTYTTPAGYLMRLLRETAVPNSTVPSIAARHSSFHSGPDA